MEALQKILRQYWGYDAFRPLQEKAVAAVCAGRDSVVILPTGGGKSLCFQAPALHLPGLAVVISPLISLMKDQVDGLRACGVEAACIHSGMTATERMSTHHALQEGRLDLLYVSPERAVTDRFIEYLRPLKPAFFAIDEAHCISQWGHDFRPEYRQLRSLREAFPDLPVHAYTATATPKVREDILGELALRDPEVLIGSFDRPNLIYRVERREEQRGLRQACSLIGKHPGESGIVYCITRKHVEALARALQAEGHQALPYHAGLSDRDRHANQEAFVQGSCDIIVATVAFGMGIDKPNVRFVIHCGMPKSIEHYQQESGRAGRDGLPADCLLLYSFADYKTWEYLQESEGAGAEIARMKLDQMKAYCESVQCRRKSLLAYFAEAYPKENCEGCDFCLTEMDLLGVEESAEIARRILETVTHLGSIAGPSYTTKVLAGKCDARMRARGHGALPSSGSLAAYSQKAIRAWIQQLVNQDFLEMVGEYFILHLCPKAHTFLEDESLPVHLAQPVVQTKKAKADRDSWEGVDRDLFDLLRELRKGLAAEGFIPPYQVFSDATLRDLARKRPASLSDLLDVHGIGAQKGRRYGEAVLSAIASYRGVPYEEEDLEEDPPSDEIAAPSPTRLAYYAFFEQGVSVEEICENMGRSPGTVVKYLEEFIGERAILDISPWVDEATRAQVQEACAVHGVYPLRPIYEALDKAVDYDAIRICAAHYKLNPPA